MCVLKVRASLCCVCDEGAALCCVVLCCVFCFAVCCRVVCNAVWHEIQDAPVCTLKTSQCVPAPHQTATALCWSHAPGGGACARNIFASLGSCSGPPNCTGRRRPRAISCTVFPVHRSKHMYDSVMPPSTGTMIRLKKSVHTLTLRFSERGSATHNFLENSETGTGSEIRSKTRTRMQSVTSWSHPQSPHPEPHPLHHCSNQHWKRFRSEVTVLAQR